MRELTSAGNTMKAVVPSRNNMLKNVQYITDRDGKTVAVIVPLNDYGELLETMEIIPLENERMKRNARQAK
jgi:PHD/YefM family antitoxin component YafN of YafNO toxin-antitoxin module